MGVGQYIKGKIVLILALSLIAWLLGLFEGYYNAGVDLLIFPPTLPLSIIAVSTFTFSFLFFGFLSPIIMFFVGVHAGRMFSEVQAISPKLVLLTFVSFAAVYSSLRLGNALLEDMTGTGNFNSAARASLATILAAVIVAVIWDIGFLA